MILYLLNKKQKAIKAIPSERLVEAKYTEGINEASKLTFSVPLESRLPNSAFFALFQKPDSSDFLLFKINDEAIENDRISYTGVDAAYDELKSYSYVKDMRPVKRTAKEILQRVLQGTRWEVGYIDATEVTDTNFYYQPCLECIQKIAQIFNMEVVFTYGFDSKYQKITSRKVNLYQQQGQRTGKRFEYGSNLLTVTREEDSQDIVTALVGRGKGEEKTDEETGEATGGYGRRVDFSNVVWSKANGDPADKPAGQEYVEDVQATKIFGYDDGKPRIGIVVFENIEDPAELLKATWASLKSSDRPKVSFKASVTDVGNLGLGDTIAIIRHELGIEYFTRVFKVTHDLLDKQNNTVEMGDDLSGDSLTSYVSNVDSLAQSAQQQATNAAVQAGSKSKNIYSNTKPQFADEGDNLFLNLGNGEFEYWVWHNHQWVFIQSTQDLKNVEQNVKEAQQDLAKAKVDIQKNGSDINNSKLEFNRSIGELNRSIIDFNQQTQQHFAETKDDIDNSKQELNRSISQLDKEIKDNKKINADNYSVIVGKISTLEDKSKIKIKTNAINANDFTESGTYFVKSTGNSNVPKDSWFYLTVVKAEDGRITQTWQNDQDANERYTRLKVDNTWRNWEKSASYNEFSQLSQTVNGINTKVINNSGDISSLNQVAKGIQTDVANNSGDISSLKQTAKGLQTAVADNAGKISSLTQSVDGVQVEVKNANSDITTLKQTAKGLQTKVDGNSTKLTTITQTVEGVKVTAEDGLKKATELSQTVDGLKTKVEAGIDKSEITQLKDQIDLKVSKGDVLSEINLEAGTSLIKSNKIYLDSDSVVFSGKAFIPDAAIANITDDKINAGTLDAGKINVINLNADNIVAGTLSGKNINMNLTTGDIRFLAGRFHNADDTFDINIDENYFYSEGYTDKFWNEKSNLLIKDGQLTLTQDTWLSRKSKPYLRIYRDEGLAWGGVVGNSSAQASVIAGNESIALTQNNLDDQGNELFHGPFFEQKDKDGNWVQSYFNDDFVGVGVSRPYGSGMFLNNVPYAIYISSKDMQTDIRGARVVLEGKGNTGNAADTSRIELGTKGWLSGLSPDIIGTAIFISPGKDLYLGVTQTTGASPNLYIAPLSGQALLTTSASRYKQDIVRSHSTEYGEKLLDIPIATWHDKSEIKRCAETSESPQTYYGMIAEDLDEAGLSMLVTKSKGKVTGINYDRIGVALVPVIKELKDKINELEKKVNGQSKSN